MKSVFQSTSRSRRHRQAPPTEQQTEQQPFFAPAGQTNVQRKPQPFFQPKLTIGKPGDHYEREADAVADAVVYQQHGGKVTAGGGEVQRMPITPVSSGSLQRAATPDEEKMPGTNDARMAEDKEIQEKPIQKMEAPKEEEKPVQTMGEEEEEPVQAAAEEEEEPVQAMEAPKEEEKPVQTMGEEEEEPVQAAAEEEEMQAKEEEEEPVQAKSKSGARPASANLGSRLSQRRGSGNPLPKSVKTNMEQSFGTDFSEVRIHTDSQAVEMNRDLHAQAFTHGQDVYFNSGKFNPEQTEGKRLLAHELTHVVQQGGGKQIQKSPDAGAAVPAKPGPIVTPLPTLAPSPAPSVTPAQKAFENTSFNFAGSNFDVTYAPKASLPHIGTMKIKHMVYFKFIGRKAKDEAENNQFSQNFRDSVQNAWSGKYMMQLQESGLPEYKAKVEINVEETKDPALAHTKITVRKRKPSSRRLRSFVAGDKDKAELDFRDPTVLEKNKKEYAEFVKQVGPFDHDSAAINSDVESDIQEVANLVRPRVDSKNKNALMSEHWEIDYIGRANSVGDRKHNLRLSRQRAQTLSDRLKKDFNKPGAASRIEDPKGEENATNDPNFRRVDVRVWNVDRLFDPAYLDDVEQNVAAHEAGHMFGLGDEYIDEAPTTNALPKFEGDKPTHYADVERLMGREAADELLVQQSDSIMAVGMNVKRGHYVYFLEALNTMTSKSWKVV